MAEGKITCAVILVGGLGTRLHPLTWERPKPLLPLANRPALNYILDQLGSVPRVLLACGYGFEAFQKWITACQLEFGRDIEMYQEFSPQGTGGALNALRRNLEGDILVINGDTLVSFDLDAMLAIHRRYSSYATLAVTRVPDIRAYGSVRIQGSRLKEFREKSSRQTPGWINAGVYLLSPPAWLTLPDQCPLSLERQIFPDWLERGEQLRVARCNGYFLDIGTHRSYLEAQMLVRSEQLRAPSPMKQNEDLVTLAPSATVGTGSTIRNCVLWEGARVGNGCHLEDCILGTDVEIPDHTVLKGCARISHSPLAERSLEEPELSHYF